MRKKDMHPDPFRQFEIWLEETVSSGDRLPHAMSLATASPQGVPSVRIVLFKGVNHGGLEFFTNYESPKGKDLVANPVAAALFWWERPRRQVRFAGSVEKVSAARSEEYFRTRSRESQIGAWASQQSQVISSRKELDRSVEFYKGKYRIAEVPRPSHWGGFRLIPWSVEFWEEQPDRLHDRLNYRRSEQGWILERLAP